MNITGTTVWPNDVAVESLELERESPHKLICFLLSPFEPRELFDAVHEAVKTACRLCANSAGVDIECRRADTLHEAKTIHDDIWRHIAAADFLVVDVTGLNPNVMIEFGVAAALRRPNQVILIKAQEDASSLPFNAFAQRYLPYRRSIVGDQEFLSGLLKSMIQAITPAPYIPPRHTPTPTSGFQLNFRDGDRPDLLKSPGVTHRRCVNECLEYGSFYVFRNSWLLITPSEYRNLKVKVNFRFGSLAKEPADAFLAISLRNQHYLANWGHMVLLRANGRIVRTEPQNDLGEYKNVDVGFLPEFNYLALDFIDMEVEFTDQQLSFRVGSVNDVVSVHKMPYVYGAGKVRLSTSLCRVFLKEIELIPL